MNMILRSAFITTIICAAPLLTGCGNSAISKVKKSSLDIDPTYTIEQAFENRPVCDDSEWDSFSDDKGRTVVQHNCELKDVESYFNEQLNLFIENATKQNSSNINTLLEAKGVITERLEILKKVVEPIRKENELIGSAKDNSYFDSNPYLLTISSKDIPAEIIDRRKGSEKNTQFRKEVRQWAQVIWPKERGSDVCLIQEGTLENSYSHLPEWINLEINQSDEYWRIGSFGRIQEGIASFLNNADKHFQCLDSTLKTIEERVQEENDFLSSSIARKKSDYSIIGAVEVFQWIAPEDGLPVIIYAGIDLEKNDGTTINKKIKPHSALKVVIDRKVQNLNDYFDDI